ncbi:MAG: MATE family efflux transporter [Treponema sp.]|nr:MATE family efflux transporter [Treponema sp.]
MIFSKNQIWSLILPLMIEQLLNSLMGTADTIMVTSAGASAISAVSLVDSINVLVVNVFSAMATGGAIVTSQYLGKKQVEKANFAGRQLLISVTLISVLGTLLALLLRNQILTCTFGKIEEDVMDNARRYFLITALSYPLIALYNAIAALFRADKNSKLPMKISTISNFLNIFGNAVMIFGFGMGVTGAALSTLLSRAFCAVTILIFLMTTKQAVGIKNPLSTRPSLPMIARIMRIGIPTGIENGMFQFGKLAIQSTVSLMGTAAIAANAMTSTLESLSCQAPIGIGLGMMTIVGQCVGAGKDDQARFYIKKLTFYGFVALLASALVICLIVVPVTSVSGMERDVALLTRKLTWFVHAIKPFAWCLSFIPAYGFRAAGDVKFPMIVSMTTMWTCRVAIVMVLARGFGLGPVSVWIGMASDWCVRSICFFIRFRSGKWLAHKITR